MKMVLRALQFPKVGGGGKEWVQEILTNRHICHVMGLQNTVAQHLYIVECQILSTNKKTKYNYGKDYWN